MEGTFVLKIELGNDAMQTDREIGQALVALGKKFTTGRDGSEIRDSGKIMDANGNSVGSWEVEA